ncbi:uncharacterized protein SCHCODRAFT_01299826 [Schizophyllum commune H4-8]|nr:uncharacterized protein SCHCODRAFT_01299826 [Schizophyllum commune H4-8]KAI5892191.1 hypothetical protein SCHCODRAFT_01299826 [Schizophyllum commune H4-8]
MPGVECNFLAPILPTARIRTLLFYRSAISELYHMGHTFLSSFSSITKLHIRADLQETQGRDEDFLQTLQSLSPQLSGGLALLCVFRDPLTYLPLFSRLSQILNIVTLHISFAYPFLPDDPHRASYTAPTFPSLQNLRLFNCSVDFVVDVLRASPAHQLRLIRVSLYPFDPVTEIAPLVQAIYERCDRERLRVLVIKSVRLPGNVEKEMEHLRPLRVFKKLTTSYFNCARLLSADLEADVIPGCTSVTPTT